MKLTEVTYVEWINDIPSWRSCCIRDTVEVLTDEPDQVGEHARMVQRNLRAAVSLLKIGDEAE
jgi:hypothetical protein